MGGTPHRAAASRLLRERAPGCHGGRLHGSLWRVLRHHRGPVICIAGRRGTVDGDHPRLSVHFFRRGTDAAVIRVKLPVPLQTLAQTGREVQLEVPESVTIESALDALEARYPVLQGAIREHITHKRRPFIRYFACGED